MEFTKEMAIEVAQIIDAINGERTMLHNSLSMVNHHFNQLESKLTELTGIGQWLIESTKDNVTTTPQTPTTEESPKGATNAPSHMLTDEEADKMGLPRGSFSLPSDTQNQIMDMLKKSGGFEALLEKVKGMGMNMSTEEPKEQPTVVDVPTAE